MGLDIVPSITHMTKVEEKFAIYTIFLILAGCARNFFCVKQLKCGNIMLCKQTKLSLFSEITALKGKILLDIS